MLQASRLLSVPLSMALLVVLYVSHYMCVRVQSVNPQLAPCSQVFVDGLGKKHVTVYVCNEACGVPIGEGEPPVTPRLADCTPVRGFCSSASGLWDLPCLMLLYVPLCPQRGRYEKRVVCGEREWSNLRVRVRVYVCCGVGPGAVGLSCLSGGHIISCLGRDHDSGVSGRAPCGGWRRPVGSPLGVSGLLC